MVGGLFTELFVDFEGFLISLMFLLPLLYLALSLIGKWNYWTIAVSFVSAFIIGALSIFVLELGFLIFPLIGWYIFYKSILRTLQMEVKNGSPPPKALSPLVVIGILGPFFTPISLILAFPISIIKTSLFKSFYGVSYYSSTKPALIQGKANAFGNIFTAVWFIGVILSLWFINKKILVNISGEVSKSKFNLSKYALLSLGLLLSYFTMQIQISSVFRGVF